MALTGEEGPAAVECTAPCDPVLHVVLDVFRQLHRLFCTLEGARVESMSGVHRQKGKTGGDCEVRGNEEENGEGGGEFQMHQMPRSSS